MPSEHQESRHVIAVSLSPVAPEAPPGRGTPKLGPALAPGDRRLLAGVCAAIQLSGSEALAFRSIWIGRHRRDQSAEGQGAAGTPRMIACQAPRSPKAETIAVVTGDDTRTGKHGRSPGFPPIATEPVGML